MLSSIDSIFAIKNIVKNTTNNAQFNIIQDTPVVFSGKIFIFNSKNNVKNKKVLIDISIIVKFDSTLFFFM
jgi:hypothetical protein